MGREWLADAVMYEIYPQSFADSDGDGVGDLRGVIGKLDHIASLGVNVIWFNPCFASPFVDAGYDVSDYLTIAPRYGTNDDMAELVARARERGIRIVLDLVAGHTSIEHPWFQKELNADGPDPEGDRYIWSEELPERTWTREQPGTPAWVRSPGPRRGYYLKNFYDEQPALNFGWVDRPQAVADEVPPRAAASEVPLQDETDQPADVRIARPGRDPVDGPGPRRNRQALKDIIGHWLDLGVAGFRVDMAFSLVKDEELTQGYAKTVALWREIREWLEVAHPDAVLIPEGAEPRVGGPLAFDADFFLVIKDAHASLFNNQYAGRLPFQAPREPFFDAEGRGSTQPFLDAWAEARADHPDRAIILATADHDFDRLRCGPRTPEQLGTALTFLFTWGSVPCLYYGDEIGMRYLPGLPNVEGSICDPGYNRAGCRTPMQWDDSPNAGFSTAEADKLYLPIDPAPDRPTVAAQQDDPASTLNFVRELIALRQATPALGTRASTRLVSTGYPLAYVRGDSHLVVVNPRREPATLSFSGATPIWGSGIDTHPDELRVSGFGYGIFTLPT
ncbi:alpha-amylase family glycosyl hydrolase [Actinoplanes sp. TRM 88003]|uniref:Alpha-amylase family glycosyl hydrolase n=1 Tax=Paractinoplanes aksuensis TaxID=2939490 RepID=A0ABT1DZ71_9ACTN|nr:alpha-amylase family glycosyl hydrolase [Actinoplanes aksuensis]MCO8275863.1 alpha-amylase family glycosyl hydrolase [Actinoplanes aksuensis]